jgi:hypothetical protein
VLADYHGLYKMVRDRDGGAAVNFKDTKEIQDRRDNATNEFMYMICAKMLHSELPCIEAMEKVRALFPEPQYLGIILAFDDILPFGRSVVVVRESGSNCGRNCGSVLSFLPSTTVSLRRRVLREW